MHDYTEDALVERPAIILLQQLGWRHLNRFGETFGGNGALGCRHESEFFLDVAYAWPRSRSDWPQDFSLRPIATLKPRPVAISRGIHAANPDYHQPRPLLPSLAWPSANLRRRTS